MPRHSVNAGFGWKPDLPDVRDLRFSVARPDLVSPLPDFVDLRGGFPPCYNQGELGSCTGNAVAALIEHSQRKQRLEEFTPSRLFIYYCARAMVGTANEDSGAAIRDAIKSVNKLGAPPETLWRYIVSRFTRKPSKKVYAEARKHQALRYQRIAQNLHHLKACIAGGFGFAFGFSVYERFESDEVAGSGIVSMPISGEKLIGGHAVVAVGYSDSRKTFIVRNSWGTEWGSNGFFEMPYAYVCDGDLSADFWKISLVEG